MSRDGNLLIVQICDFLDVGDGVYRFHAPSRALGQLPGVMVIDIDMHHRALPVLAELADVLVLAGFDWDMFPLLQRRRATGRISVFEANDYYYDIQPWNPLSARWMDRSIQDSFRHGLLNADGVQASTQELARRWRQRTDRPVAVFENQLTDVPPLEPPPPRPLTIGWGGSPGHFADWYHVAPVLTHWLRVHPDVHLAVMNNEFARPFIDLPPQRYRFRDFGSLADYLDFLKGIDIGLAPLLPSDYNRCRSDVKFLEYAASGVAGIYCDLEPYHNSVVDGQTGLLYRNHAELIACLDRLASDARLRQAIRQQAHSHVSQQRRLESHIGRRLDFYYSLLNERRSQSSASVPPEILRMAQQDGRYYRLPRQQPEEKLKAAIDGRTMPQTVQSLKELVEQFPRYLPALQHLGRQLNDQRQYRLALEFLGRARPLAVDSARTLCEIARALYMLDDESTARRMLESALANNPCYHLGWQYLLVLLERTKAGDGAIWANKAHAANPANFALALLGVKLYPRRQAIAVLQQLIDCYQPTLLSEEMPLATAAFGETIAEIAGPVLGEPDTLPLLQRACAAFPASAKLAILLGQALYLLGSQEESQAQFVRANSLRQLARTWQLEFPREDGSIHYGQFAEHIRSLIREEESTVDKRS